MDLSSYYGTLKDYLRDYLPSQENNPSRSGAREKLTRLNQQQFTELSIDVYDELQRRQTNSAPYLVERSEFHPKRNQARQKLSSLPQMRFKDLVSDVVFEIERRQPNVNGMSITSNAPVYNLPTTGGTIPLMPTIGPSSSARSFDALGLSSGYPTTDAKAGVNAALNQENAKLKSEYEQRLAGLYNDSAALKQDYERRIAEARQESQNQINMLMNDLNAKDARNRQLEDMVAQLKNANEQINTNFALLRDSNDRAQHDVLNLQDLIGRDRQEMATLRQQVAQLTQELAETRARYDALVLGKQQDAGTIRQLSQAVTMMTPVPPAQTTSQMSILNSAATSMIPMTPDPTSLLDVAPKMSGIIVPNSKMEAYQAAAQSFVASLNGPVNGSTLMSMKSILVACKGISVDVEGWEKSSVNPQVQHARLQPVREQFSSALGALMSSAKNHTNSAGATPGVATLKSQLTNLTTIINQMVSEPPVDQLSSQMSNVSLTQPLVQEAMVALPSQSTASLPQAAPTMDTGLVALPSSSSFFTASSQPSQASLPAPSMVDNRINSGPLLQAQESLPSVVVNAPSEALITEKEPQVQVLSPPPPTETIQETTPISRSPRLSPRLSPLPMDAEPNPRRQSWAGAPPISPGLQAISPPSGTSPSPMMGATVASAPVPEMERQETLQSPPPVVQTQVVDAMEVPELKTYLEKQTDQIVQAIQALLFAMRQSTTYGQEFKDTIRGITSIVDDLVVQSRATFAKPSAAHLKAQGENILDQLTTSNRKLEELGDSMVDQPQSKTLKQKLASASYEVAKEVKELISLI